MALNDQVREFWEAEACGTTPEIIGELPSQTREWFEKVEEHRYRVEPFIHSTAQFTRHHKKKLLEIGVGAGTDHLQWVRAGAECYGVDMTDMAIETTRAHLAMYGLTSNLQRMNAEKLPFDDGVFDLVYSWGVIHHSENPEAIIDEIRRVLKPGGLFIGMMYSRHSVVTMKLWIKYGLFRAKPWRSFKDVVWHHMESIGTKAYTISELKRLFAAYSAFTSQPVLTTYDTNHIPARLTEFLPESWGWFITIKAIK
jgi:ubiquinone/menaquinone biosynthesis C-methylase UbiE